MGQFFYVATRLLTFLSARLATFAFFATLLGFRFLLFLFVFFVVVGKRSTDDCAGQCQHEYFFHVIMLNDFKMIKVVCVENNNTSGGCHTALEYSR